MLRPFWIGLATWSALVLGVPIGAGGEIKVFNQEKVNTDADDDDPFVTGDGLTLFYASNKAGSFDIWMAKRSSAGQPFAAGKPYVFSKDDDERSPFLFRGVNLDLYYAANPVPDEKLKDLKNFDIFKRTGERAPLYVPGVSQRDDEMHPWITPSGKEFYFSRRAKEGWVLFMGQGPVPGPVGNAKEVGFPVGFCRATLTPTGLTMYLQGPLEDGRTGIFRSRRPKLGAAWSMPEPVKGLGHAEGKRGDLSPCLSGERLYFASDRPGGKGGLDIWSVLVSQLK